MGHASPKRIGRPRVRRIQQATNKVIQMSRIPTHSVEDAPTASRPLLQKIVQSTPTGRPANLHAQMAHSPAVLAAYTSLRAVTAEHGTLDPKVSWALNLATAGTVGNDYMIGIASRFARMNGWSEPRLPPCGQAQRRATPRSTHWPAWSGKLRQIRETSPTPHGRPLNKSAGAAST